MATPSLGKSWTERVARGVLVVVLGLIILLVATSLVLGPIVLFPVLILALLAVALAARVRRGQAQQAAELAHAIGARQPVTVWGKVIEANGRCPTGRMPAKGQLFAVAGGIVWPALCVHARRRIIEEAGRIERGAIVEELVHYHDADHHMAFELHEAEAEAQAAA